MIEECPACFRNPDGSHQACCPLLHIICPVNMVKASQCISCVEDWSLRGLPCPMNHLDRKMLRLAAEGNFAAAAARIPMKLEPIAKPKEVLLPDVNVVNPCCSGFTTAAKAGAFRFYKQSADKVVAYLVTPVHDPGKVNNRIHNCPYCGTRIE